jgi:hypothetical protein
MFRVGQVVTVYGDQCVILSDRSIQMTRLNEDYDCWLVVVDGRAPQWVPESIIEAYDGP